MGGLRTNRATGIATLTLLAGLVSGGRASAEFLSIGSAVGPAINVNYQGADLSVLAGSLTATLDGVALPFLYCVEFERTIYVPGSYAAEARSDGVVHGGLVNNAGAVAWLVDHFAATATTADQQGALQAAIWRTLYGSDFKLRGVDSDGTNASGVMTNYTSYLTALGTNVDPVSNVRWLSPRGVSDSNALYQGQVTSRSASSPSPQAVPEPSAIVLTGLGGLGLLAGLRRSSRRRPLA